jgi:hypothetical protein
MTTTIPGVREQVRQWTGGRSAKDADDKPQLETIAARDLKIIGRVGKSSFATHGGRELRLKGPVMPYAVEQAGSEAIVVRQPVRSADGRTRTETYLATVVGAGTFERLHRQKVYRGPKERRLGPVDGLLEARAGAPREVVRFGSIDGDDDRDVVRDIMRGRPQVLFTDGKPPLAGVVDALNLFQSKGANLRHLNGRTLVDWNQLTPYWRDRLVAMYPLLDAAMAGTPLACGYEHKQAALADTLDPVGVPVCNGHVGLGPLAA